jgi:hypothetical protein
MHVLKYICLGVVLGIGLTWGWSSCSARNNKVVPSTPALADISQQQAPFEIIYKFYHALDENKTEQLAELVTPEFLAQLNGQQEAYKYFKLQDEDPSLRFAFFLITEKELDLNAGQARVKGSAEWVSTSRGAFSVPQTVTLINYQGEWKMSSIVNKG